MAGNWSILFLVILISSVLSANVNYNGKTVSDSAVRTKLTQISTVLGSITLTSGDRSYVPPGGSKTSLHLAKRAAAFYPNDGTPLAGAFSKLKKILVY